MRLLVAVISLVSLAGCGVDYCVLGIGTCAHEFANAVTPTPVATPIAGPLTITGCNGLTVTTGTTVTCAVSGGSGSYTYLVAPSTCGLFTNYGASASLIAQAPQVCTVTVSDSLNSTLTATTTFTVQ